MAFLWLILWVQGDPDATNLWVKTLRDADPSRLMEVYQKIRPEGPQAEDEQVLNQLGYQLLHEQQGGQALAVFLLNTQLFPSQANPLDSLAEAHLQLGNPEQSVFYYEKAFEKEPDRGIWERLGEAYQALGDAAREVAYGQRGLKLYADADAQDVALAISLKHGLAGNPKEALEIAEKTYPRTAMWRSRQLLAEKGVSLAERADGWKTSTYAAVALDPTPFSQLVADAKAGRYENLHGIVIVRGDTIIGEAYFEGYNRYRPHDTRSTGKSILALIAGIAIDQGKLGETTRLYDLFPEYRNTKEWDTRKGSVQIRHLLAMSSGLDAFDNREDSPGNENFYQERVRNWEDHVLRLPMAFEPGTQLVYASANYLLLGNAIAKATQQDLDTFAEAHLFAPLGITHYHWFRAPDGKAYGAGGIRMTPRDLAKLGHLVLKGGRYQGRQVVSQVWTEKVGKPYVEGEFWSKKYGLGWYFHQEQVKGQSIDVISAAGNGGQRIWVMPQLQAVAVVTMGNYNSRKQLMADSLLKEVVVPSLIKE